MAILHLQDLVICMGRKQETFEETWETQFPGNFLGNHRKLETRKARTVLQFSKKRVGNFPIHLQFVSYTLFEGRKQETFYKTEH